MFRQIIYKPENHPSNIGDDGIPILSPRLRRTINIGLPKTNTIQGVIDHLSKFCFIEASLMCPGRISIKARFSAIETDNSSSISHIDMMFRDGVHTLSNKIWIVSKHDTMMTSAEADVILNRTGNELSNTVIEYMVYIIDMLE